MEVLLEPVPKGSGGEDYCAVGALRGLRRLAPEGAAADSTPVFQTVRFQPLRPQVAIAALRALWDSEEVEHDGFMLHSIRKFAAVLLCVDGSTIEQCRVRGRWSTGSNAVLRYAERMHPGGRSVLHAGLRAVASGVGDLGVRVLSAMPVGEAMAWANLVSEEDGDAMAVCDQG